MNNIKNEKELHEVYGKENNYINLFIPTVNVLLLLENLDKIKKYSKQQLLSLTYYYNHLLIGETDKLINDLEYNIYTLSNKKNLLSGGSAIKYIIEKNLVGNNAQHLRNIIIEDVYISTNNKLINYDNLINRNERISKLVELCAPELIVRNEKRSLQKLIDEIVINDNFKNKLLK